MAILNDQLRDAFLTPAMECYFAKKLPELDRVELGIRIEETLKFLNIATYCHGNIPVTKEIDEIWHFWILETYEYERLCRALQGGQFIHHSSNAYRNCCGQMVESSEGELGEKVAMLGTYVLNYGPFQADRLRYWTFASHLVDDVGWSLDQLNEWLGQVLCNESQDGRPVVSGSSGGCGRPNRTARRSASEWRVQRAHIVMKSRKPWLTSGESD